MILGQNWPKIAKFSWHCSLKIDQSDYFGVGFNLEMSIEKHSGFPFFPPRNLKFELDVRILENKFLRVVCYRYHTDKPQ